MTIEQLAQLLCKDVVVGTFARHGQSFIVTRFSYPVGDSVNLYLVDGADGQRVTDLGTTSYVLRVGGIDMEADGRQDFIESVCTLYNVDMAGDFSFSKLLTPESASADVMAFLEAITRVSTLAYFDRQEKRDRTFRDDIERVLTNSLPKRRLVRDWYDPAIDPQGMWKVDFHLNTLQAPFDVYAITSRLRAESAAGTINFLRANHQIHKSMTIVSPGIKLPRSAEKKLEMVSRLIFGVDENEKQISEYADRD